jgi:hypothetical protein
MLGVPHASRRMVKEKQQLMDVSSSWESVPSELPPDVILGLVLSTQVVRTAFWFTLNATSAYFCVRHRAKAQMFNTC